MQFFVNSVPVCGDTVPLGVQGENLATQITADVSGWLAQWPDGQVIVRLIDANRQSHLADTVVNDGTLVWIVTAADTAQGGYGVGVIELVQGDVVKKSEPFATRVVTDPAASGEAPEPVPGWVEETIARMEELEASAAQSADDAQTSAGSAQTGAQSAQAAAAQAAQSAEDAAAVLPQVETAGAAQVTAIQAAGQQQTQAVTAAGAQQVSAVQTEGADQRAAIETAGAAQVNAIQAEGQTQQTAIQQKGADTLASIPADYTELSGDVADLKSEMNKRPSIEGTDETDSDFDIADSQGYVVARFADGHIQTKEFNSADILQKIAAVAVGFEYKFSGNDLLIGYGYNATHDAVIVLNCGRANGLFDFAKFALKTKGTSLENLETADLTTVWNSGTDMHSPFQFNATTNPDGYYSSSSDPSFTGGNHTVTIDGNAVQSASSEYVHFFADGKPVSTGYGRCARFEIRWANNVQAYNCVKADGTGRTSLVEYHDMIFDGVQFNEEIMLMPTEEISMRLWYGLQSVSWNQTYTSARFVDAENRGPFASTDSNVESGNAVTSGIIATGAVHSMEMTVNTGVDLGKRTFYSGTKGAFFTRYDTGGKGYFSIVGGRNTWGEGEGYFLRGSFRFYPTVS